MSRNLVTRQPGFFSRLANLRLLAAAREVRSIEESPTHVLKEPGRWTSRRFSRVVERRSSRQVSVTTRKAWMLSPDPSLSMIESGYESDRCRGR